MEEGRTSSINGGSVSTEVYLLLSIKHDLYPPGPSSAPASYWPRGQALVKKL